MPGRLSLSSSVISLAHEVEREMKFGELFFRDSPKKREGEPVSKPAKRKKRILHSD